jgi:uncharacterized membrane-anchored protein YjiN (DUF445 family)
MKLAATGLLVVALVVFIAAKMHEDTYPWLAYVRATAEASLVGGIADWFAVTALFRHPLGIPIPHTAIMQKQKDRVGKILGNFVQNHFLSRAVLEARLAGINPAQRAATWMREEANRRRLAKQLAGGLARAVEALPEVEVREFVQRSAVTKLEGVKLAPLVSEMMTVAASGGRPQELLNEVMKLIGGALKDGHDSIRERVRQESPRWVPVGLRDAVADRLIGGVERLITEMLADPLHPMRKRFDGIVHDFITRMKTSPEMIAKIEGMKVDLLGHPIVEELVSSVWDKTRLAATSYRADPEGTSLEPLEEILAGLSDSLSQSDELRAEVDRFITEVITSLLEQHRQEIADLIAATVADWDPEVAAGRIELAVGRDLQFVRLNGTLVGGAAGLVIYTLSRFL